MTDPEPDPIIGRYRATTRFGYPLAIALTAADMLGMHLWHWPQWLLWVVLGVAALLFITPPVMLVLTVLRLARQERQET